MSYTAQKCVELLVENLHSARNAGDVTLEEAEMRLRQAIESQAKYLEDNPETWVLTPEKFLRPDRPHGTLLSALRLFVKEPHTPQIPPENPENESARERKNRLYAHLLSLGANRTHPGTFSRWYSEYGPQHLEACMTYMAQQAERRRQAGKPQKREFDSNRGGASAYFASLIARFDSQGVQRELGLAERQKIKNALWEKVFVHASRTNLARTGATAGEMSVIYHRMCAEPDFRDATLRDTNAFFQMRIENYTTPTFIVLAHHVLQQQNNCNHADYHHPPSAPQTPQNPLAIRPGIRVQNAGVHRRPLARAAVLARRTQQGHRPGNAGGILPGAKDRAAPAVVRQRRYPGKCVQPAGRDFCGDFAQLWENDRRGVALVAAFRLAGSAAKNALPASEMRVALVVGRQPELHVPGRSPMRRVPAICGGFCDG
jgi:hypothetical protein